MAHPLPAARATCDVEQLADAGHEALARDARLLELDGAPIFFTNQTMTHLTMHAIGARPLDTAKYVLQLDDQFVYRDFYADKTLAMRHYVNPVRHKFWTHFSR